MKSIDSYTTMLQMQETPHTPWSTVMMYKLYASESNEKDISDNVKEIIEENAKKHRYSLFLCTDGYQSIGRFKERNWYTQDNPKDNPTKKVQLSLNEQQITFPFTRGNIITVLDLKHDARHQVYKIKIKYLDIDEHKTIPEATEVLPLTDLARETYDLLIPYFDYTQPAFLLPKNRLSMAESMYQNWKAHYPTPHFKKLFDMPFDKQVREIKKVHRKAKRKKKEWVKPLTPQEQEWELLETRKHELSSSRNDELIKIWHEQGVSPEFFI